MINCSIIITNYNYGLYLERCIRSCLAQKLVNHELVIVDDCSTDQSHEIIEKYKNHENVTVVMNEKNLGVAATSNIGIKKAKYQYVVRVDSDDYVSEFFLLFLSEILKHNPQFFGVACDYEIHDSKGLMIEKKSSKDYPISCGVMYRKDDLVANGLYSPDWRHREEEELRARLGDKYKIYRLPIPLYRYVHHGKNKTLNSLEMAEAERILNDRKSIK